MMPWMRSGKSKRLFRDQYSIGSSAFSTTQPGMIGSPMTIDTHSSKRIDIATTHFSADATAPTSSRHVRTLPMKSACRVVMYSSSRVIAVVCGHADHASDAVAHTT